MDMGIYGVFIGFQFFGAIKIVEKKGKTHEQLRIARGGVRKKRESSAFKKK